MPLVIRNQSCPVPVTPDKGAPNMQAVNIFIVSVSPIALAMSTFALIVLTRRRAVQLGSMRINLTTLTAFETLLNAMIFMFTVSTLTGDGQEASTMAFTIVCFFFINGALCARNWIITLIALARCIAITRPMATRLMSTHLFRPRSLGVCTVLCIVTGFLLSLLRLFEQKIVVCENLGDTIRLAPNSGWRPVNEIFFIYQSAMPISIVLITTMIMITVLLRNKTFRLDNHGPGTQSTTTTPVGTVIAVCPTGGGAGTNGSGANGNGIIMSNNPNNMNSTSPVLSSSVSSATGHHHHHQTTKRIACSASQLRYSIGVRQTQMCAKSQINYRRTHNQLRATRMITLLAAAFILFEAPIFFCIVFRASIPHAQYRLITNALKALVVLDSCANVVIYLFMSKRFRKESSRLWTTMKIRQSRVSVNQTEMAL